MIQTICVCGAGTMGSGIAQVAAQSGFYALLYDVNATILDKAKSGIEKNLSSLVEKKKMTAEEKAKVVSRIKFIADINDCLADIIIEAIVEKTEIKSAL